MSDDETQTNSATVAWLKFLSGLWVVRGVVLGFSILTIAEEFSGFSRNELLRAVHFTLLKWDQLIGFFTSIASHFFSIPHLDEQYVRYAIVFWFLWVPVSFLMLSSIRVSAERIGEDHSDKILAGRAVLVISILGFLFYSYEHLFSEKLFNFSDLQISLLRYMTIAALLIAAFFRRDLRSGLMICMTAVLALELLYFINHPTTVKMINGAICAEMGIEDDSC